jgi:hypothetical protein
MLFPRIFKYLKDLLDVVVSSPTDGDVLKYQASSGRWVNGQSGGAFLPISGGTLTGQLTGPGGNTFDDGSGNMAFAGQLSGSENEGAVYFDNNTNLHFGDSGNAWVIVDDNIGGALFCVCSSQSTYNNPKSVFTSNVTIDDGDGNFINPSIYTEGISLTIGDWNGVGNNTTMLVDDVDQTITLVAGHGVSVFNGPFSTDRPIIFAAGSSHNAAIGGSLFETFADAQSTTSTSAQTLVTHTLPANLLVTNKDKVRATFAFTTANNAHTKSVTLSAFGTTIWTQSLTVSAAGMIVLDCLIIRVSASAVRCIVYPTIATTAGTTNPTETDISGLNLGITQTLALGATIGTGATAGDVTAKMDTVEYLPYSGN